MISGSGVSRMDGGAQRISKAMKLLWRIIVIVKTYIHPKLYNGQHHG
jgi:hypothetical protein